MREGHSDLSSSQLLAAAIIENSHSSACETVYEIPGTTPSIVNSISSYHAVPLVEYITVPNCRYSAS
ncbi:unknown [Coraliomargarita sp. CAG:312]|nr:unknown [Coraliomargarita sp. CAG:312]